MLRFVSLNPRVFVDLLVEAGCELRIRRHGIQQVVRPGDPTASIVVRMGEPVPNDALLEYLEILGIDQGHFKLLLDRYRPKPD